MWYQAGVTVNPASTTICRLLAFFSQVDHSIRPAKGGTVALQSHPPSRLSKDVWKSSFFKFFSRHPLAFFFTSETGFASATFHPILPDIVHLAY